MTRREVVLIVLILTTLADAASTPLGGLPSGELYCVLMRTTDLDTYNRVLATLKSAGYVEERYHFLTASPSGVALGKELQEELDRSKKEKA